MPLPELGTVNGKGIALLGVDHQPDGSFYATAWKVRWNMPITPISRHRVRFEGAKQNNLGTLMRRYRSFELLEDTPLSASEIRSTRIWHYLIAPLVLLGPLLSCVFLWGWLGEVAVGMGKGATQGHAAGIIIGLVWLSLGGQIWVGLRNSRVEKLGG